MAGGWGLAAVERICARPDSEKALSRSLSCLLISYSFENSINLLYYVATVRCILR